MEPLLEKIKRNIKKGTLIQNASKAVKNRIVKGVKQADVFYRLDYERVLTKKYQAGIPNINSNHFRAGNYYLDRRITLDKNSIVYSLGILADISFDLFISNKYGCKVYMYDPTPVSVLFMKKHELNSLLKYTPVAVWTENTTLKFYEPASGGSASAVYQASDKYFEAKCFTMETLMRENNHVEINVFKADIEGAALPILEQMIEKGIFPHQIIVEFERPEKNAHAVNDFFNRVSKIRDRLKDKGYEEFLLPRKSRKYYSLEILFADTSKMRT